MSRGLCASLATLCAASLHVMGTDRRGGKLGVGPLTLAPAWCSVLLSQAEVCSGTVADVLQSVVSGADGCIFSFGHTSLGKHPPSHPLCSLGLILQAGRGIWVIPYGQWVGPGPGRGACGEEAPAVLGDRGIGLQEAPWSQWLALRAPGRTREGRTLEAAWRGWALRACQAECGALTCPRAPQASPTP